MAKALHSGAAPVRVFQERRCGEVGTPSNGLRLEGKFPLREIRARFPGLLVTREFLLWVPIQFDADESTARSRPPGRTVPWAVARVRGSFPHMTQEPDPLRRKFQQEEDDGRVAIIGWLRYPGVTDRIAEESPAFLGRIAPLVRLLPDQLAVFRFALRAAGGPTGTVSVMGPDGFTQLANEWASGLPNATPGERAVAGVILAAVNQLEVALAREIQALGAPIDPESALDLVALLQLLLLDFDLTAAAGEIADELILFGPSGITPDGRGIGDHRDGRPRRGVARAEDIRSEFRRQAGGIGIRAPYARGSKRSVPATQQVRRDALREVIVSFPKANPKAILNSWRSGSSSKTAGGMLRELLQGETDEAPSLSTLQRDFKALKQERTSASSNV